MPRRLDPNANPSPDLDNRRVDDSQSDKRHLVQRSRDLQQPGSRARSFCAGLLKTRAQRDAQREVTESLAQQAGRVKAHQLAEQAHNLQLEQDIRAQLTQDAQRIEHRKAMLDIDSAAEDDLTEAVVELFCNSKRLVQQLSAIDGDDELKALVAQRIDRLTFSSARDLQERNRKPR